ncbi:hypothetical protein P7C70_g8545, partial [Phenoliferia sp. Uapishka_3]
GGMELEESDDDEVIVEEPQDRESDWEDQEQRKNARNIKQHQSALNGDRRASRPVAQDFHSPPPPNRGTSDHDLDKSDFLAMVQGALARGGNYEEDLDVPDFVRHCRSVEQKFRRFTAKGKGADAIGDIIAQIQVRIDPKDIQKILFGEHLPLCDVHSYEPRHIFEAPEGFEALIDSRFEASRAKIRPLLTLSALDLIEAWDLVSAVDAQFFPSRTQDRLLFRNRLRNLLRGSNTEVIHRIGTWVDRTGREIATIGGKVSHWGQANSADALYTELVTAPAAAAAAALLVQGPSRKAPTGGARPRCNNTSAQAAEESIACWIAVGEEEGQRRGRQRQKAVAEEWAQRLATLLAAVGVVASKAPLQCAPQMEEGWDEPEVKKRGKGKGRKKSRTEKREKREKEEKAKRKGGEESETEDEEECEMEEPWMPLDREEELPEPLPTPPEHHLEGVGVAPRLRRLWHWPEPHLDPPKTPLLTSTLTAKPLPRPPKAALEDPLYLAALKSHPHLFRHETPLNVDAFEVSLKDHPNRPWVESLLISMREGFWPCHSGEPTPPPGKSLKARFTPRTEEDLDLVEAQVKKDVDKGWTSPRFKVLPAGFVVSPLFVVRRDGSDPRVVDDQTASELNKGIERKNAPAIFDTIPDLIRLARHKGLKDLPPGSVWWKTDASAAFKIMSMHPSWQFRQAVSVSYKMPDGSRETWYHIEWRGAFGTRATPYLWTSIMGAILWIVQQRGIIENPLAYMDDAFGLDTSGIMVERTYHGETKTIPQEVAEMLDVWYAHGIQFGWKKVVFGVKIPVLGIALCLETLTASLPEASVKKYTNEVRSFLAHPERCPPLKWWRSITGYGSYVCTVVPHARLWLTPLYEKLSFKGGAPKNLPHLGVFINVAVIRSLEAIVEELERGEPLSLVDPGLTEWGAVDADLVVYTDACLESKERKGQSGLGFWFELGGVRHHYYARPRVRYAKIQLAETLTVAAAIECVLALKIPGLRRLLVRTDSSAAVFAYDSGASSDTDRLPLRSIILGSYIALRKAKVDVRVLHVSGKDNDLADRLSRAPVRNLLDDYFPIYSFNPPNHLLGNNRKRLVAPKPARGKEPTAKLSDLMEERDVLWAAALAPRTFKAYRRDLRDWKAFALSVGVSDVPTADTLSLFVTYRLRTRVDCYGTLSGLQYMIQHIMGEKEWKAARFSPEVARALRGSAKVKKHIKRRAPPLPHSDYLRALRIGLDPRATYDQQLWASQVVTLFLCCGRAGEVCDADSPQYRDVSQRMTRERTSLTAKGFKAFLPYMKNDPLYVGSHYYWTTADAGIDAVKLISRYIIARDARFGYRGPLWLNSKGKVPVRRSFVKELKKRFGWQYTGHSMRPGGATWYVLEGADDRTVQRLGRWKSKAWEEYIRLEPELAMAARIRDAGRKNPHLRALNNVEDITEALRRLGIVL